LSYIQLRNISKSFPIHGEKKGRRLLKAVEEASFSIEKGKTFGLVGESGSGKSTIAKMIVGLYPPTSGTISIGDRVYGKLGRRDRQEYQKQLSIVFQNPYASLDPKMTIFSIISEPMKAFGQIKDRDVKVRVAELLDQVGLSAEQHLYRYPHEFSGGQRQRIAIARSISFQPGFLILDEPTSALDVSVQAKIINLLTSLQKQYNLTYLFISHNMGVIRHVSNMIGVMYRGKLLEIGDRDTIIASPLHPYSKHLISSIPRMDQQEQSDFDGRALSGEALAESDGCPYAPRCPQSMEVCFDRFPDRTMIAGDHEIHCHLFHRTEG